MKRFTLIGAGLAVGLTLLVGTFVALLWGRSEPVEEEGSQTVHESEGASRALAILQPAPGKWLKDALVEVRVQAVGGISEVVVNGRPAQRTGDNAFRAAVPLAEGKDRPIVARVPGGDEGSDEARADAFVGWLARLKADLGIPAKLSDYNATRRVTRDDIAKLVEIAIADTCHQTNPRPCTADDFRRIFAAAM